MKEEDLKILKQFFKECEFKASGNGDDCECEKAKRGKRIWFESTNYEHPDEGDYFCDEGGLNNIKSMIDFCDNYPTD